jgi:hypothetical protein
MNTTDQIRSTVFLTDPNVHLLSESPVLGVPAGGFTITPWGRHTMGEAVTVS